MSLESWCAEFYPVPAEEMLTAHPIVQAQHALRKWTGALPHNLAKHNVKHFKPGWSSIVPDDVNVTDSHPYGGPSFAFGVDECVWCNLYNKARTFSVWQCRDCPLYLLRNAKCFERRLPSGAHTSTGYSPYEVWCNDKNPIPMIIGIQQILRQEINKEMKKREPIQIRPLRSLHYTAVTEDWVYISLLAYPTKSDRNACTNDWTRTVFDLLSAGF